MLKADFHGAVITVVRSTIPTTIGIRGILLQETYRSFKIITEANKLVSASSFSLHVSFLSSLLFMRLDFLAALSKAHSIFSFAFGSVVVRLYGDQLIMRAAERTVKKFKQRNSIEL